MIARSDFLKYFYNAMLTILGLFLGSLLSSTFFMGRSFEQSFERACNYLETWPAIVVIFFLTPMHNNINKFNRSRIGRSLELSLLQSLGYFATTVVLLRFCIEKSSIESLERGYVNLLVGFPIYFLAEIHRAIKEAKKEKQDRIDAMDSFIGQKKGV